MDLNISLIEKINHIINLTDNFDKIFIKINNNEINDKLIENIYSLTNFYILIRSEHGGLIILMEKIKEKIINDNSNLTDNLINKLYDLSTFSSIIENISNLVSNIDFQYKKIAIKYPQFITKNIITLALFINKIEKNNKFVKIFEELKTLMPEYIYKIIETDDNKKINCQDLFKKDIKIKIKKTPELFIINNNNIINIPINKNVEIDFFKDLLKNNI